jgi:uncharacterized delta-60 repeat protein
LGSEFQPMELVLQHDAIAVRGLVTVGTYQSTSFDGSTCLFPPSGGGPTCVFASGLTGSSPLLFAGDVRPDDKIVVAGSVGTQFLVARYLADLQVDHAFGSNGSMSFAKDGTAGGAYAVRFEASGGIVVAGSITSDGLVHAGVARIGPDQKLDTGYATSGYWVGPPDSTLLDLAIQPDDRAVAVGFAADGASGMLLRLRPDGISDIMSYPDGTGALRAVALQSDGRIVVVADLGDVAAVFRFWP